jgi:arylsulfatase A
MNSIKCRRSGTEAELRSHLPHRITTSAFLITLAFLLLSPYCKAFSADSSGHPNIVLFLADDLGFGDLACYGHPAIQSPNLDAFAKQGVRLTQCYAASAVCSPSRSAILTGRTPHRNGVFTWIQGGSEVHLRASEIALPKVLKQKGYTTCHVGKWHLNGKMNDPSQPQPNDHGYDWYLATQNNAEPGHKNPNNFVRNGKAIGEVKGYSSLFIVDEAIDWLKTHRDKSKPFFLAVWTHEPHFPIETDDRFLKPYANVEDPELKRYYGNVTQLDRAFGNLMKALDEQKLAENTFVIFTSDNGPEGDGIKGQNRGSAGGLRGRKASLYEGGIREPGIVRWPGHIKPGSTCDAPIIGSDFFTTAIAVAGAQVPGDRVIDGANVLPVLTGEAPTVERKQPLYWRLNMAQYNLQLVLRQGDWKLLASQDFTKFELFNLKDDPKETMDQKDKEKERFEAMKQALKEHNAKVEAEGPDWWKRLTPKGGGPVKAKK